MSGWFHRAFLPPTENELRRERPERTRSLASSWLRRAHARVLVAGLAILAALTAASLIGLRAAHAETIGQRPCDIYAADNTPCVAAHSTARSLYAKYDGALYQVKRASDKATETSACVRTATPTRRRKMHFAKARPASLPKSTINRPATTTLQSLPADTLKDLARMGSTSVLRRTH